MAQTPIPEKMQKKFIFVQIVSLSRIPLALLVATILIYRDQDAQKFLPLFICLLIMGMMELTDVFDGILARKFGIVSEWGAMIDPYSDSISRLIVFWGLACSHLASPLVPIVMAVRDVTVAYSRIILTRNNKSVSAKTSGKIKAIVQGVAASLMVIGPLYWQWTGQWVASFLSWTVIIVTAWSSYSYVKSAMDSVE